MIALCHGHQVRIVIKRRLGHTKWLGAYSIESLIVCRVLCSDRLTGCKAVGVTAFRILAGIDQETQHEIHADHQRPKAT